ncbi:MAG: hypothetical protein C5B51_24365 [Terriglobia bacterium]|nr:MAG: hypothetical protein C5B51_24365 [Terriglobia bacterium]
MFTQPRTLQLEWTMRSTLFLFCLTFAASAQTDRGAIAGAVSDPLGSPLAKTTVQAKDTRSGEVHKAVSEPDGKYTFTGLPSGTYDVTVNLPGLKGFERKAVSVEAGKTLAFNIRLEEGTQLSTLGEDPLAIAADSRKHAPPSGPTPRTKDGKPDLSGTWWQPVTVDSGKPEFLPWALALAKERGDNNRIDSPQTHCLPGAVLRLGPIYQFVQSKDYLVEISDDDNPGFHQIYLDGRVLPKEANPQWYGNNVGRWEGDTLVVDRSGFDERVWLDQELHPHTNKLHVIERYRRPDLGHLETEITVEDPGALAKPYTIKRVSELAPTEQIYEFICGENNKDLPHLRGK